MHTSDMKEEIPVMLHTLGQFIRDYRISLRMSQEELAVRAQLHRTYVSDVERGLRNLTLGAALHFARGLGIELHELAAAAEGKPIQPRPRVESSDLVFAPEPQHSNEVVAAH